VNDKNDFRMQSSAPAGRSIWNPAARIPRPLEILRWREYFYRYQAYPDWGGIWTGCAALRGALLACRRPPTRSKGPAWGIQQDRARVSRGM